MHLKVTTIFRVKPGNGILESVLFIDSISFEFFIVLALQEFSLTVFAQISVPIQK